MKYGAYSNAVYKEPGMAGMLCPSCSGHRKAIEHHGTCVHHCRRCFGLWRDKGALARFGQCDPDALLADAEVSAKRTSRHCPRCYGRLTAVRYLSGEATLAVAAAPGAGGSGSALTRLPREVHHPPQRVPAMTVATAADQWVEVWSDGACR